MSALMRAFCAFTADSQYVSRCVGCNQEIISRTRSHRDVMHLCMYSCLNAEIGASLLHNADRRPET